MYRLWRLTCRARVGDRQK